MEILRQYKCAASKASNFTYYTRFLINFESRDHVDVVIFTTSAKIPLGLYGWFISQELLHLFNTFRVISLSKTIVLHDLFSLMTYLSDVIKLLLYGYCKNFGTSNIAFHSIKYIPFQVILVTLHKMACIRTLLQVVHSQYIYWHKTNIRMWQDI